MSAKEVLMAAGTGGSPTFISSSSGFSSTTLTSVPAPSNIQDGDLLVVVGSTNDDAARITPPAGFNQIAVNDAGQASSQFTATRVVNGDSGGYFFTQSPTATATFITILAYRNASTINTVGILSKSDTAVNTLTAPSITPTYAGTLVAIFATLDNAASVSTPPSGMTQRRFGNSPAITMAVYDLVEQPASATGSKTLIYSDIGRPASWLLQVTNEPIVAPEFVASEGMQAIASTTVVVNKPAGTVAGDLMIAVLQTNDNTSWSSNPDWIDVAEQLSFKTSMRVAYKVAGASEPSTYTFTISAAKSIFGSILTYRYASFDTIGSFITNATPLLLTSPSRNVSQSILIAAGANAAGSITLGTPISMTARVTDNNATGPSCKVCDQVVAKGQAGTRAMSSGGTSDVAGIMFSIKPTRSL